VVLRNPGQKPLNFFLPYRKDKLGEDQILRCFDGIGTMITGPRSPQSAWDAFGGREVEYKPQRLEAGKAMVLDVELPGGTALAAAQVRGGISHGKRMPDEDYFRDLGPSKSRYVVVRR
jgi:hypothetical protein